MVATAIPHPSVSERRTKGFAALQETPPATHGDWQPQADRFDPVELLVQQNANREPDLVPVRHGRMAQSPFTFYRGAARVMAADLAHTPRAGLDVQLCGDAHLSNFGMFASPERRLMFDLNDFDETLPGPFEYDVKRMAASFMIAARNNGLTDEQARGVTASVVKAYREAMAGFAQMRTMDVWYANLSEDDIRTAMYKLASDLESPSGGGREKSDKGQPSADGKAAKDGKAGKRGGAAKDAKAANTKKGQTGKARKEPKSLKDAKDGKAVKGPGPVKSGGDSADVPLKIGKGVRTGPVPEVWAQEFDRVRSGNLDKGMKRAERIMEKARSRDSTQALGKLAEFVDGQYRIVSQPPVVVPLRDMAPGGFDGAADRHVTPEVVESGVRQLFREYRATLRADQRHLVKSFQVIDIARKVVGVGSVGTRCFIALLEGRDSNDPLFIQVKEATRSVLEDHLPRSRYQNPGERVVRGQRLMQAASDIFLGWTKGVETDRYFYWRQLRDMKGSVEVETLTMAGLAFYGQLCGWTLARAHARAGDPVALAEYLGNDNTFDQAIAEFSRRYADQNERDYQKFVDAIRTGRIEAIAGV